MLRLDKGFALSHFFGPSCRLLILEILASASHEASLHGCLFHKVLTCSDTRCELVWFMYAKLCTFRTEARPASQAISAFLKLNWPCHANMPINHHLGSKCMRAFTHYRLRSKAMPLLCLCAIDAGYIIRGSAQSLLRAAPSIIPITTGLQAPLHAAKSPLVHFGVAHGVGAGLQGAATHRPASGTSATGTWTGDTRDTWNMELQRHEQSCQDLIW